MQQIKKIKVKLVGKIGKMTTEMPPPQSNPQPIPAAMRRRGGNSTVGNSGSELISSWYVASLQVVQALGDQLTIDLGKWLNGERLLEGCES